MRRGRWRGSRGGGIIHWFRTFNGQGAFVAQVVGEASIDRSTSGSTGDGVRVRVEGRAFYTGYATFLVEGGDGIGEAGFAF